MYNTTIIPVYRKDASEDSGYKTVGTAAVTKMFSIGEKIDVIFSMPTNRRMETYLQNLYLHDSLDEAATLMSEYVNKDIKDLQCPLKIILKN